MNREFYKTANPININALGAILIADIPGGIHVVPSLWVLGVQWVQPGFKPSRLGQERQSVAVIDLLDHVVRQVQAHQELV